MFGGRERPPYKPGRTATLPVTPARGTPLPGGIYASPTNKGTAYTTPKTLPQGEHLQAGRKQQASAAGRPRRGQDLRAKSQALRPGCAPKRACGRSPALQSDRERAIDRKPRAGHTPAGRHICLPYKHPIPCIRTPKRFLRANEHGGAKAPPYRAAETGGLPANPAGRPRFTAYSAACAKPRRSRAPHTGRWRFRSAPGR